MGLFRLQAPRIRSDLAPSRRIPVSSHDEAIAEIRCVFYGDMYGCGGENPQQPMTQLEDFVRARKHFA
jgi:hypothetical protein